jgi:enoyl-CoA hydratase/carnithine racemase
MWGCDEVITEVRGRVGFITLNRPKALNALSLPMIRALAATLLAWRDDPAVDAVAIRGSNKAGVFGAFCAGGDIRFFHQAVLRGDAELEDFFTEEYRLNHTIHTYPKPYIAFMDGIVMGGGMGISQGARWRIVTPRSKVAMPETNIGLFPDVGGGYFLSRCPGAAGEWLALTGDVIDAATALQLDLADTCFEAEKLQAAWDALAQLPNHRADTLAQWVASYSIAGYADTTMPNPEVNEFFAQGSAADMVKALEASSSDWAQATAATLRTRSPLMMEVTLELVRRARHMTLAQDLRLERDIVRHCFNTRHLNRFMADSETTEGIRALVIDKDNAPMWNPARVEEVTPEMVLPFFDSPWPAAEHPLKDLV